MKKRNYGISRDNSDAVLEEKWLAAFRNPSSKRNPDGITFIRQFYAAGFYEAYDIVATYAEKMNKNIEVLWFKEKKECGEQYIARKYPMLESFCTYCNRRFNHIEPIPCGNEKCDSEFCSRKCMGEHLVVRHKLRNH